MASRTTDGGVVFQGLDKTEQMFDTLPSHGVVARAEDVVGA